MRDDPTYPLMPLRDTVVFPHTELSMFVGRLASTKAIEAAMAADKKIFLVAQRSFDTIEPTREDLYPVGTLADILDVRKLPDGTLKVIVAGRQRAAVGTLIKCDYYSATATPMPADDRHRPEIRQTRDALLRLIEGTATPEFLASIADISEGGRLADRIAGQLPLALKHKQDLLETQDGTSRLSRLLVFAEKYMTAKGQEDVQVESVGIQGFDSKGEPEIRRMSSGQLWLVFEFMPPSWVPENEYASFGRCKTFDKELEQFLGAPVLWDDREFFKMERPLPNSIERIKEFLALYRQQNDPGIAHAR